MKAIGPDASPVEGFYLERARRQIFVQRQKSADNGVVVIEPLKNAINGKVSRTLRSKLYRK